MCVLSRSNGFRSSSINVYRLQLWLQLGWNDVLWLVGLSRNESFETATQLLAETLQSKFIALY